MSLVEDGSGGLSGEAALRRGDGTVFLLRMNWRHTLPDACIVRLLSFKAGEGFNPGELFDAIHRSEDLRCSVRLLAKDADGNMVGFGSHASLDAIAPTGEEYVIKLSHPIPLAPLEFGWKLFKTPVNTDHWATYYAMFISDVATAMAMVEATSNGAVSRTVRDAARRGIIA